MYMWILVMAQSFCFMVWYSIPKWLLMAQNLNFYGMIWRIQILFYDCPKFDGMIWYTQTIDLNDAKDEFLWYDPVNPKDFLHWCKSSIFMVWSSIPEWIFHNGKNLSFSWYYIAYQNDLFRMV